jgi:predicted MPP superfamily phosphohydrolase
MRFTAKKIIIIIVLVILAAAAAAFYLNMRKKYGAKLEADFTMITTNNNYDVKIVKQEEEVTYLAKESGGDFKIMALTDMHLDGLDKEAMDKTMEKFQEAMDKERPDLVIFTGDIVPAIFNKERAVMLAELMEKYGIYWCPILGNHEGEHPLSFSRENLIKLWSNDKKYPHCLVESGPKDIYGYGNYVVNLLNSEQKISQSLIFIDSGDNVSEEDIKKYNIKKSFYAYIKADQIEWYKEKINALPEGTKSSLFIHIPLNE